MSEEKFSKCEGGKGEKKGSVEFRVFGEKNENERKVPREKKSKCFGWKCKVKDFAKFVFTVWGFY